MPERCPQSVGFRCVFKAYLAKDHSTAATGRTIAMQISKNGGALGNPSGGATNATEMAQGFYYVDLTTTDVGTLGPLLIRGTQAQIDPVELLYQVVNAHNAGFDALPNATVETAGGLYTRGSGAGQINQTAVGQIDTRWVAGNVTVGTNNDKTGYGLSGSERSTLVLAVWDALTSVITTAGSIGKLLTDNVDAAISSRSTYSGGDTAGTTTLLSRLSSGRALGLDHLDADVSSRAAPGAAMTLTSAYDAAKTAAQAGDAMTLTSGERSAAATAVWAVSVRTLTGFGSLVTDIWAAVTDSAGVTTLLSRLTSGRATALDHLDADVSSRLATVGYTAPDNTDIVALAARLTSGRAANLDALDVAVSSRAAPGDAMTLTSAYNPAKTAAQAGDAMTLTSGERSSIATAVWSAGTRTLTSVGTLVADIWAAVTDSPGVTTLLGRLTSGRASALDHLDVDVSTRLADADYVSLDATALAAIQARTDLLPDDPATETTLAAILADTVHLDVDVSTRLAASAYTPGGTSDLTAGDVLLQVQTALSTDTYAEPAQEVLPTPAPLAYMLSWMYKLSRNKLQQTNTQTKVFNDAGTTIDQVATVSDDGTTFQRGPYVAGP